MERYLILGSGAAGKRAAEVIRKGKADAEIVLVGDEPDPFYYRPMLGEFLAQGMRADQIASPDRERLSKLGVRLMPGVTVTSLNVKKQEVLCDNGEKISFDKLLIASGRKTARLAGQGADPKGVAYLDNLADAQTIASLVGRISKAVVVGSSIPALDVLRGLRGRGVDCTFLVPEERFWPGVLDPVASQILEDRIRQEKITVLKGAAVREALAEQGRLQAVLTTQGDRIPADLLVVAAPLVPRLEFLGKGDLKTDRGIVVDASLRTSHENIFAAGDVAQAPLADGAKAVPQPGWLNAWRQGNVAGLNMTGKGATYQGVLSLRIKAFDLDVVCLGSSDATGPDIREESGGYPYEELPYIYKKLVFKKQKTSGAVFVGDVSEAGKVEHWIRQGLEADRCDKKVLDQMFQTRLVPTESMGALCPVCKFQIQVEEGDKEGKVVTCPACGCEFRLERMPNRIFRAVPVA